MSWFARCAKEHPKEFELIKPFYERWKNGERVVEDFHKMHVEWNKVNPRCVSAENNTQYELNWEAFDIFTGRAEDK